MINKFKLVCFDMDGTLIRNTNSVEFLCQLNNKGQEVKEIEEKEDREEITWIEADFIKANLLIGLEEGLIKVNFRKYIRVINNLEFALSKLKSVGLKVILVTAGPIQVAQALSELFSFNKVYGSEYEVIDRHFTGKIMNHLGDQGKLASVMDYCNCNQISLDEVVSVGDSSSDIEVFRVSGKSIAINYSKSLIGKADEYIVTEDLKDILRFIMDNSRVDD